MSSGKMARVGGVARVRELAEDAADRAGREILGLSYETHYVLEAVLCEGGSGGSVFIILRSWLPP